MYYRFKSNPTVYLASLTLSVALLTSNPAQSGWKSELAVELQSLTDSSHRNPDFSDDSLSLSLQSELHGNLGDTDWQTTLVPYARWDQNDSERNHIDLREAFVLKSFDQWVFQAGLAKVFWGVAESQHLVDIINQTDNLEGSDGENKLGQPLIRLGYEFEQGALDFYLLPAFREREFLSYGNRLGAPIPLSGIALYEAPKRKDHIDFAVRWSGYRGPVDFALSYFDGTAREPSFVPSEQSKKPNSTISFDTFYPQLQQTGAELQYTGEAWLWKLETINSTTSTESHSAAVGGFEYTFFGLQDGVLDLGIISEYHIDSRSDASSIFLQNDLFLGARLSFNDAESSSVLAGLFVDLDDESTAFRIEGSRRISDNLTINIEAQVFSDSELGNVAHRIAENDYIRIELKRYF